MKPLFILTEEELNAIIDAEVREALYQSVTFQVSKNKAENVIIVDFQTKKVVNK